MVHSNQSSIPNCFGDVTSYRQKTWFLSTPVTPP